MLFNILNVFMMFTSVMSHVSFYPNTLPYTSTSTRFALKVPHGCLDNSTNKISSSFPDNFVIKPEFKQGWTTTLSSDGILYNISWVSDNVSNNIPASFNELFYIWITIPPSYVANTNYYVPTIQYCYPSGENVWTATPTTTGHEPAPYYKISSSPTLAPTPFSIVDSSKKWTRIDKLTVSVAIISIISLLMNLYNEYRLYFISSINPNNNKKQVEIA